MRSSINQDPMTNSGNRGFLIIKNGVVPALPEIPNKKKGRYKSFPPFETQVDRFSERDEANHCKWTPNNLLKL